MSGLSSLLGQRPISAGSPLGMMGLMSMFSQMGVKSSQLPNRPSNSQSNPRNSGIQGATANPPSSSNSQESADVFSLLHNICDKVSVMREDDKRKGKERDEARREENGTADEQPDLGNTQMNNNSGNSVEEIRYNYVILLTNCYDFWCLYLKSSSVLCMVKISGKGYMSRFFIDIKVFQKVQGQIHHHYKKFCQAMDIVRYIYICTRYFLKSENYGTCNFSISLFGMN